MVYGAVEPLTGELFYRIEPPSPKPPKKKMGRPKKGARKAKPKPKEKGTKSRYMNEFMKQLTEAYPNDHIVLVCDNACWHNSQYTKIPERMTQLFIPPCTPEMNPIEQIWREIRTRGFRNKYFKTIKDAEENIHTTIASMQTDTIKSITQRDWIMNIVKPNSK
jgi:putative transposase